MYSYRNFIDPVLSGRRLAKKHFFTIEHKSNNRRQIALPPIKVSSQSVDGKRLKLPITKIKFKKPSPSPFNNPLSPVTPEKLSQSEKIPIAKIDYSFLRQKVCEVENLNIKGTSNKLLHPKSIQSVLYEDIIEFMQAVEHKFGKLFREIDSESSGTIDFDDIFRYLSQNSRNTDRNRHGDSDTSKKVEVILRLCGFGSEQCIQEKDFMGLCSVHYYYSKKKELVLYDDIQLIVLERRIRDVRRVFNSLASNGYINLRKLKENCKEGEIFDKLFSTNFIDFSTYLKCVPLFMHVYYELQNQ